MLSSNFSPTTPNIDEIMRHIQEGNRADQARTEAPPADWPSLPPPPPGNIQGRLGLFQESMERAVAAIGEPTPEPSTLRGRVGSLVMRWLGRILWWYTRAIQSAFSEARRQHQEEARVLQALANSHEGVAAGLNAAYSGVDSLRASVQASVKQLQTSIQECSQGLQECNRTLQVLNARCGNMEAAQVGLQARQIEHSVLNGMARIDRIANELKESFSAHQGSVSGEMNAIRKEVDAVSRVSAQQESALARLGNEAGGEKQAGKELEKLSAKLAAVEEQLQAASTAKVDASRTVSELIELGRSLRVQLASEVDARVEMAARLAAVDDLVAELTARVDAAGQPARTASALTQRLDADAGRREQRMEELRALIAAEVEARVDVELRSRLSVVAGARADAAAKAVPPGNALAHLEQLSLRVADLGRFTHQTRTEVTLQARRISLLLDEARKSLPKLTGESTSLVPAFSDRHKYDAMYMAFEDVFRGTRDEIKSRQSHYLPILAEAEIGSWRMPVLDLGSGRGEWLQLLHENGMQARGVDANLAMAEQCTLAGLNVTQGDALCHLRGLPDSSVGAVTSFHLIEHLPFDQVLEIVDEALRVLKPGGLLILETPNPQNLQVGAFTFYFDPTHVRPLPSVMLQFFVEARGFRDVQVKDLNPFPDVVRLPENANGVAHRFNEHFYGPQDYAVVAKRP